MIVETFQIQVITGRILNKSSTKAIATKVMVQMAAKMGAEPWRIKPLFPSNSDKVSKQT